jgi:hypothetical protein
MRLYSATCEEFYADIASERIADVLTDSFKRHFGRMPGKPEQRSWQNSLTSLHFVAKQAGLGEQGVILEYELPYTSKRLDVMFCGANKSGADSAMIVELKQWEECEPSDGDKVLTWVGGGHRDVLHPSVQVGQYRMFMEDGHTAFHEGDPVIGLEACAFLHNYRYIDDDPLLDKKFDRDREEAPLFTKEDRERLTSQLEISVGGGAGDDVLRRVVEGEHRASRKLMDHVGSMLEGRDEYVLLDEQLIAYDRVMTEAKAALATETGASVLIRGGPGTGKSVIALNLIAGLSALGHETHYATGSKAFTLALRKIAGTRASQQFKYFNQYGGAPEGELDVLICDEAHRIRKTSANQYTKKADRTDKPQIAELLDASKVSVFFVDDLQVVRPGEVGSADLVREASMDAERPLFEYELTAQFRCAGSEGFINWVTDVLEIRETANPMWNQDEEFEFQIVDSPEALMEKIAGKVEEGVTARVMAGFCWPWSNPLSDGTLEDDVVIGDFARPWNARSGKGRLAKGIPKEHDWARDPGGIEQIGCVYTAQGFEFDYAGIIFGPDLVWREGRGWVGQKAESHDGMVKRADSDEAFADLVKNTYRVLMTRGMKGCYVHFMDAETETHFRSRVVEG